MAHAALEASRSGRSGSDQVVSSQGDFFVYGVDDLMVCRRTGDLGVVWTHRLDETPSARVWRVAISARADRVAAVAAAAPRPESPETSRRPLVLQPLYTVYDGRSGKPIARFPADIHFSEALALSPDGKLLAVAQRIPTVGGKDVDLLVAVYDIASSRLASREPHCRVPRAGPEPSWFRRHGIYVGRTLPSDVGLRSNDRLGGCGLEHGRTDLMPRISRLLQ